ncbi:hypothetical protein H8356DRAFT_1332222 [Neocallimastix lanati (nom. inval.)]|nr:hypothetical protein H8356DRAFT_1332222 [Neocallimastix sp. JGI-2020a]
MASNDTSDPILADIHKASLSCKDLLMEICQWTKEANREKNVTDSLHKLINELEDLERYEEVKEEDTLAAISVNLQNLLPILLSNNISMDQLEIKIKEANTLGIELITTLNKIKDKWLKNKGKISYINTSIQDLDEKSSSQNNLNSSVKRRASKRKSNLFTKSFHNSISHLSHSNNHSQQSSEDMEITGPINSPLYMQEKKPSISALSPLQPPKTDPDMLETILRALPPKPTSSPFEVNAVPPLEIGKSYINNNNNSNNSNNSNSNNASNNTSGNENIQLPKISYGNEESLEQNLLNVFDFIYGSSDNLDNSSSNRTENKSNTNLYSDDKKVDNYEFKQKNGYEYISQEIPETPLSESVFNQLSNINDNNYNNTRSREVKAFSIIKEENEKELENYNTQNITNKNTMDNQNNEKINGYNIFLQYKGETKRLFIKFEDIAYDLLKDLFKEQFNCKEDFKDEEFPKIYINNQNMINLFYELSPSCSDIKENSILKLNIETDELISEIKELKTMINKSNLSLNVDVNNNDKKEPDDETGKVSNNPTITINTNLDNEKSSNTYKELYDIRKSILDIVNNFVNSPVVKENKEVSPTSDIQDLKDTINDWINYQKHISSLNTLQTPISANADAFNSPLVEPYKNIENIFNDRINSIQDYMNNEISVLNKNVSTKLDDIATTINEKSPTSSVFKTPESEVFLTNYNNDIKNNMNNSINELKSYIKEVIEAKIDEKMSNSSISTNNRVSGSNSSLNNTINELKNNVQAVNDNINTNNNNLINQLIEKISLDNDQKLREIEKRLNQKLEELINYRNKNENNEMMNSLLENINKSFKDLKISLNSKNNEIERLTEITEKMNENSTINNKEKEDEQLKYMEFTKNLEEDIKQQLRKFKNDICNNMNGTISEENNNEEKSEKVITNYDQDTIDYVKQIRDNVDKQLLEFRRTIFDIYENIKTNSSSSTQKGFNPEMIETIRSFRTEMKNQYQDFTEIIKQTLSKQEENNNKISKDLPNSGNKIIKDNTYNLINNEFFKLRQFMVEVIKISQTRKTPKAGEIGQLPLGIDEQQSIKKNGMTTYNNLTDKRNEINVIKKNIKNIKQQFETFRFDYLQNISKLKSLISLLSKVSPSSPSEQRQKLLNEKKALNIQSEIIRDKLQELRLLLESIGVDVSRKCNPKVSVMNYVKNEIKMINSETQRFTEVIKNINVNWKGIWEKELQEIVSEQKILKTSIENSTEFEEDCKTLSDGFSVILKVLSMQKDKKEFKMNNVLDPEELQESGLHNGLMDEIKLVTDEESSTKRLDAIEKSLKIQEIIRENSKANEFEVELNNFIETNKYKINKNVMEFEKQQNAKKDEILKEMWKNERNNVSNSNNNSNANIQDSVPAL